MRCNPESFVLLVTILILADNKANLRMLSQCKQVQAFVSEEYK
jgi:hypothetical protein